MPTIALLNQSGEKIKNLKLSDEIFGIEPNRQVIYDVVNCQRAAMRQGTHDTKGRSEVRGGGRKPWRQKGTDVLVKDLFVLHNGVVVELYLDQLQEAMLLS